MSIEKEVKKKLEQENIIEPLSLIRKDILDEEIQQAYPDRPYIPVKIERVINNRLLVLKIIDGDFEGKEIILNKELVKK